MISIMCAWTSLQPVSSLLSHLDLSLFSPICLTPCSCPSVIILLCAQFTAHFFPSLPIPLFFYIVCSVLFHLLHLFVILSSFSISLSYLLISFRFFLLYNGSLLSVCLSPFYLSFLYINYSTPHHLTPLFPLYSVFIIHLLTLYPFFLPSFPSFFSLSHQYNLKLSLSFPYNLLLSSI